MAKKRIVTTTINGREEQFLCEPRQTLLEVLRYQLDLTGAKPVSGDGSSGASTVILNGKPVMASSKGGSTLVRGTDRISAGTVRRL